MTTLNYSSQEATKDILATIEKLAKSLNPTTELNPTPQDSERIINTYFLNYLNELIQTINIDYYNEEEKTKILEICQNILNS